MSKTDDILKEMIKERLSKHLTERRNGKKGSFAETYANEHNYEFVNIENDNSGDNNTIIMGDLDGNKKVNLNDAKILLKGSVGIITLTDEQKKAADMNNDKKINLNDAKIALLIAVGVENQKNI